MSFSNIHNYYEKFVFQALSQLDIDNEEQLEDIACVTLNQLPARYVRHDVDMAYYMTMDERQKMEDDIKQAIKTAIDYVNSHNDPEHRPETISQ